jgi:ribosomal-protein-alanine N-acetyltransferase
MRPDDLGEVIRLQTATPEAPQWPRAVYEAFLSQPDPPRQIFLAEDGGKITGFAAAQLFVDTCELASIVVDASVRRTGLGSDLLVNVIEWAQKKGAARLELEVRSGSAEAISFYERAGLRPDGLRRGYYSDPADDALLMSLSFTHETPP